MPVLLFAWWLLAVTDESAIRAAVARGTGFVDLPEGVIEVSREIVLPPGAHDLDIRGAASGTVLRASPSFQGRAIFVATGGSRLRFHGFSVEGSRAALAKPQPLPPSDVPFSRWTRNSALLFEGVRELTVEDVTAREVAGFAVLVSRGSLVHFSKIMVEDSGQGDKNGRNNATGGILLEEGTTDFEVLGCSFRRVGGNGIWTHSLYRSPRNARGRIVGNSFSELARDAIQVGHATDIRVEGNSGDRIGWPQSLVDVEHGAVPAALDTAGNVDRSVYFGNHFVEINGKCIDLDGFHDGEVRDNICENHGAPESYPSGGFGIVMNNSNPDMHSRNVTIAGNTIDGAKFGGIFLIGTANRVTGNRLLNLNMAHCPEEAKRFGCFLAKDEPDILRSGIYLGRGAERPDIARGNTVEGNLIVGYGMGRFCIRAAPGVSLESNRIGRNECSDDATVNARNRAGQLPNGRTRGVVE